MMNNTEIIKVIHDIFTRDDIDACYIFGSFLTSRFTEQSDIDIAVVGNIELEDRLYIEGILEEKLNRSIDLVNIEELPKNIQLQIVSRNKKIIFKENENTNRYLYELDKWYKEEYPFWLKLQRKMGYEKVAIIPSSIHECILVPLEEGISETYLNYMVSEVNKNNVPIEEILSDHIYIYNAAENKISNCSTT